MSRAGFIDSRYVEARHQYWPLAARQLCGQSLDFGGLLQTRLLKIDRSNLPPRENYATAPQSAVAACYAPLRNFFSFSKATLIAFSSAVDLHRYLSNLTIFSRFK